MRGGLRSRDLDGSAGPSSVTSIMKPWSKMRSKSFAGESRAPSEKIALYKKLVGTRPGMELKGDTIPHTSLNGHMFSYMSKDGAVNLRLPEGEREAFLKKFNTQLCEEYGEVQDEYVVVPGSLLARTDELKRFFDMSYGFAGSLKPKPAAKKKVK